PHSLGQFRPAQRAVVDVQARVEQFHHPRLHSLREFAGDDDERFLPHARISVLRMTFVLGMAAEAHRTARMRHPLRFGGRMDTASAERVPARKREHGLGMAMSGGRRIGAAKRETAAGLAAGALQIAALLSGLLLTAASAGAQTANTQTET